MFRPYLVPLLLTLRRRALHERRRGRSGRFVALTALAAGLLAAGVAIAGAFVLVLLQVGLWWLALVFAALLAYAYFPWAIARSVAVPLGRPRLAFHLAAESREIEDDPIGGGLVMAAWALCRQAAPSAEAAAWIEARRDASGRLGDCRVVATALLAAARGDRDGCRALLESVALLPEVTPAARELAAEWLAADDAERGAWQRILDRAPRRVHAQLAVDGEAYGLPDRVDEVGRAAARAPDPVWPATPMTYFLEGVAGRLLGLPGAPGDAALLVRWLEAPRRRHTWSLYLRATTAARATEAPAPSGATAPAAEARGADPVGAAVGAHVAALAAHERGALEPHHVVAAARAWDRALASADARHAVLARAIDVGAPSDAGSRVLDDLARTAADDLAALVLAAGLPVGDLRDPGAVLGVAVQRVRHRLLADLELAISRTATRVHHQRALPAIDEWRELLALRAAHARAVQVGGDELRRLAFPHLHEELTPWLVWLWNQRAEHALSDALTTWLLAEALAVGDAQAIETHARNASMSLPSRR